MPTFAEMINTVFGMHWLNLDLWSNWYGKKNTKIYNTEVNTHTGTHTNTGTHGHSYDLQCLSLYMNERTK